MLMASLLTSFGANAQCGPQWLPGQGVPGITGNVRTMMPWDPDGGGPLAARLVVAGQFSMAGGAACNNIAVYDHGAGTFSPLGQGINALSGLTALAVLPNGELLAAGGTTTEQPSGAVSQHISRWDGNGWSVLPGISYGLFQALAVLPNGDIVVGGRFSSIVTGTGSVSANGVARWNGTTWAPLGSGITGSSLPEVEALTVLPNGDLVASGNFSAAGGVPANNIARWNGSQWASFGTGMNSRVLAVQSLPGGDLVAAGTFSVAGGVIAYHIARWDGANWSALASGTNSWVRTLCQLPNGSLIAAGDFSTASGVSANRVAQWNGTTWAPLGGGIGGATPGGAVRSVAVLPNGDVVAGGEFPNAIRRWDGISWLDLSLGFSGDILCATTMANGDLVAGGSFATLDGFHVGRIVRWDGTRWLPLGSGMDGIVRCLATLPNGDLVAGGNFSTAGGVYSPSIARWNGVSWQPLGAAFPNPTNTVAALAVLPNGDLVVGGSFIDIAGVNANSIARWNGTSWQTFGSGSPMTTGVLKQSSPAGLQSGDVRSLLVLPNGDLIVGGRFVTAAGVPANNIARWDGAVWSPLGVGVSDSVAALSILANGNLVAGGDFAVAGTVSAAGIASWDGTAWSSVGASFAYAGLGPAVWAFTRLPNGDLIAGGRFWSAGGVTASHLARWNGFTWSPLVGGASNQVFALAMLDTEIMAGGSFTTVGGGTVSAKFARLAATCPATIATIGTTCAGSSTHGDLQSSTLPWVGSTHRSFATGFPATTLVFEVLGFASASLPLPMSPANCLLLATPDLLVLHTPSLGRVETTLLLPNTSSLAGTVIWQQLAPLEVMPSGQLVLTSTNALQLSIGTF